MIAGKQVLGLIPARGGSKGLPRKNVLSFVGKPLIAWTIEAGRASRFIDKLVVSTDDAQIAEVALRWGAEVPFIRPAELANDDTPAMRYILHALDMLPGFEYLVLLQPTSPLRTANDIDEAIGKCIGAGGPACVSVTKTDKSPHWMYMLGENDRIVPILRPDGCSTNRQELLPAYLLNGAIYVADIEWLKVSRTFLSSRTIAYNMPTERSIDIDTYLDFQIGEMLFSKVERGTG